MDGLTTSQRWSAEELRAGQQQQLTHLLRFAAKNVPWYGRANWARDSLAVIAQHPDRFWEQWQTLPLLAKTELRASGPLLDARALPAAHLPLGKTRTSGSLGIPVVVSTTPASRLVWNAGTVREHLWQGRDFSKRLGVIRSHPRDPLGTGPNMPDWGPPVASIAATGPGSIIHIGQPLDVLAGWLNRFNPHYLLTYPSLAAALLEHIGAAARPPALEEVRMISEPLDPELEQRLAESWQVRVSDMYSANEVGHIAFRCLEGNQLHVQSELILVEILDEQGQPCATGETGRVVVTALHNIATVLIRYDIGDYATVGEPCRCGRSHPVIGQVRGRVRNLVRTPDGRHYWPSALVRVRFVTAIRQFQYVQTALDAIELRVVLDRPLTAEEEEQARNIVQKTLGYPFRVEIKPVAAIERGPTGKFEEFLSQVAE